ncbi:MAG: Tn3 family transposase, partial [Roseovarius sp.]|nr:Tn3 family transposase [Roseovarius sp.]
LYQTVKAFGQIIKTLFILRYADSLELRQAIEGQLNKVELANRFSRAVAVGSPRALSQTEPDAQAVAEGCNRLIRNCIICWNYLYLTRQMETMPDAAAQDQLRRTIYRIRTHIMGPYEPAGRIRFFGRKAAGQHRNPAPE